MAAFWLLVFTLWVKWPGALLDKRGREWLAELNLFKARLHLLVVFVLLECNGVDMLVKFLHELNEQVLLFVLFLVEVEVLDDVESTSDFRNLIAQFRIPFTHTVGLATLLNFEVSLELHLVALISVLLPGHLEVLRFFSLCQILNQLFVEQEL